MNSLVFRDRDVDANPGRGRPGRSRRTGWRDGMRGRKGGGPPRRLSPADVTTIMLSAWRIASLLNPPPTRSKRAAAPARNPSMPRGNVTPDGRRLAALRGEAGLTQQEMALQARFGLRTISKIEAGRPTSAATLDALATVLARRLGRPVRLDELMHHGGAGSGPGETGLAVAERVKVLDLR